MISVVSLQSSIPFSLLSLPTFPHPSLLPSFLHTYPLPNLPFSLPSSLPPSFIPAYLPSSQPPFLPSLIPPSFLPSLHIFYSFYITLNYLTTRREMTDLLDDLMRKYTCSVDQFIRNKMLIGYAKSDDLILSHHY